MKTLTVRRALSGALRLCRRYQHQGGFHVRADIMLRNIATDFACLLPGLRRHLQVGGSFFVDPTACRNTCSHYAKKPPRDCPFRRMSNLFLNCELRFVYRDALILQATGQPFWAERNAAHRSPQSNMAPIISAAGRFTLLPAMLLSTLPMLPHNRKR